MQNSKSGAVYWAIETIGHLTSMQTLIDAASTLYGETLEYCLVATARRKWRAFHQINDNQPTHRSVTRRNMLSDSAASPLSTQLKRKIERLPAATRRQLARLANQAHSIDLLAACLG